MGLFKITECPNNRVLISTSYDMSLLVYNRVLISTI